MNTRPAPVAPTAPPAEQAMLDAARDEFERYGIRRTNMDDVAKRAGISRSTLYRKFPNKDALVEVLVLREAGLFFDQLDALARDLDPVRAVVECFARGIALTREIPLLGRILESEPEMLVEVTTRTEGAPIAVAAARVAAALRHSGATMPEDDLLSVSEILIRISMSLLLHPHGRLDTTDPDAVRHYAERYLARLVW
ncbi:TetR/AcrR family transcriptional regulator [Rhodococcus sp. PvR044]|jgi:TetR/AcrR family transcriptional regulator|uniref:TetR/AcrR family transcriptional regulator n=1 Tax=unclassified Rhodococcus (in: high G+C Gram-positive bacteria) TaxID=192944 RepID=UPI000BE435AF|nr:MULTISPECIES: TetR/AcrR family transcriptional regulator [unclassified Rhodococcus (in: high G+C Gram-positive bacteria)]MBP1158167.1 AcrR family transcriptional regulator [Rhodococcus sp. PvR099]